MAKGISINIGLNTVDPAHYNGWDGRLRACEFDANDMAAVAEARGFDSNVILTKRATARNVSSAIRDAAKSLDRGDFLFLTYSGHGGQVPDTNTDEARDDRDETWVLFDRQLVDDELYTLWGEFRPGVRIFVLSDSCHSGTVTKAMYDENFTPYVVEKGIVDDESPRTKDLPIDVQDATYEKNRGTYDDIQKSVPSGEAVEIGATILLISGCQDNQLSLDGSRNGLFTQNLLRVWNQGRFDGTYRAFWKSISERMPPTQSPNFFRVGAPDPGFRRQTPLTL